MGLFNKTSRAAGQHHATTVIAEGTVIDGKLDLTGNIQIDGRVIGRIQTEKTVTISPSGKVQGSIFAERAIINGHFEGDIYAHNVEVLENGNLQGEVSSAEFTIVKGGLFLGSSKTVPGEDIIKFSEKKEKTSEKNNTPAPETQKNKASK